MSADVVEKFRGHPRGVGGNLPQRSVIVGVGPPSPWAARAGRLAAVEPEPLPVARVVYCNGCGRPDRLASMLVFVLR
jgi:hypothetical protein